MPLTAFSNLDVHPFICLMFVFSSIHPGHVPSTITLLPFIGLQMSFFFMSFNGTDIDHFASLIQTELEWDGL